MSDEYFNSTRAFIDIAKIYTNEEGLVPCPCRKCVNWLWQQIGILEAHIIDNGFNLLYKKWRYHREPNMLMKAVVHEQVANTGDEMLNVLEDVIGLTHELPIKYEDFDNFEIEPSHREKYDDRFAEMESKLYLGCQKFFSLNFLTKLIPLKVLNK